MEKYDIFKVENLLQRLVRKFLYLINRIIRGLAHRTLNKKVIEPRSFSNEILKYYAPLFSGSVINVSGWQDEDKEGGIYKKYFTNASSYVVSNAGTSKKGLGSGIEEFEIDLSIPISKSLKHKYNVVFNHTTLEHVYKLDVAFKNLCDLSSDVVVLVVPVLQQIHFNDGYGDYNRITTMGVVKHFEKNGFEVLIVKTNEQPFAPVYCFAIAVRNGSAYKKKIDKDIDLSMGGELFGSKIKKEYIHKHISI